ncbi:hypothetical protein IJV79_02020, partial [bacterium]|nr:hypothetical protein [bacterium]
GTYSEGCPTGTCMELTVDTNGNKYPNKSGKDIFTMLVTDRGIKALGESNMCETGLDCGAYILANHKLYDGTVEEVAPPEHTPTEPEPTPEEIYNNCVASEAVSCTNANGELVYRDTNSCKASGSQSCTLFDGKTYYPNAADYSLCKTNGASICTTSSGQTVNKLGNYYGQNTFVADLTSQQSAAADCMSKGMHLASIDEIKSIYNAGELTGVGYWSSTLRESGALGVYKTFWADSGEEGWDRGSQQYYNMQTLCIAN